LVLGDSLSAAYGMELEVGWVALLQQRLVQRQLPYHVINASISGDTTAGGLARLSPALERHQPDVLIIELGGNDGLRGLPLTALKDNLGQMIEKATARGTRVLVLGVQIPPNYGRRYVEGFQRVFHEVGQTHGVPVLPSLLDGVHLEPDLMQTDGIHPSAKAQPLILDNVWRKLEPLLKAVPAAARAGSRG